MQQKLFHAWRSFNFDENTETIDSYVMQIRTGSNTLGLWRATGIGSIQNTLPTKLYWILFPIEDSETSSRNSKENTNQKEGR